MAIKGEAVTLFTPAVTYDENKDEVMAWTETELNNVLFASPSTEQMDEAMRLYSVHAQYTLHFPKTFTGSLRGCYVVRARDVAVESEETQGGTQETGQSSEVGNNEANGEPETSVETEPSTPAEAPIETPTETQGETPEQPEPPKYWIAGDPQPYPPELCPTPWNREAIAGWVDG